MTLTKALMIGCAGALLAAVAATAQEKKAEPTALAPKPAPAAAAANLDNPAALNAKAPETFKAKFETTKGDFVVEVKREWSPNGADRFYNLVKNGYYDGVKFFRVVPNFVVQWGIHGNPALAKKWLNANIQDDQVRESNKRGRITYAKSSAPNSRSVQLFINLKDNTSLDGQGFSPFGEIVEGMDVVDKLHSGYGEKLTSLQGEIAAKGNAFLEANYPMLDTIKKATVLK